MIQIRRGQETFSAPDATTLRTWLAEGRVLATDLIAYNGQWLAPSRHPDTAGVAMAPRKTESATGTPFQLGCFGGVMLVAGPVVGGMLFNSNLMAIVGLAIGVLCIVAALIAGVLKR